MTTTLVGPVSIAINTSVLPILAFIAYWIARHFLVQLVEKTMMKSKYEWDDIFVQRKFFPYLARLVPVVSIYAAGELLLLNNLLPGE